MLYNTTLRVGPNDRRRMDLVASPTSGNCGAQHGLTLFCDATVCSPLSKQGIARTGAHSHDGQTLDTATRTKRRTYHDVVESNHVPFLVLGCEVFGRCGSDVTHLVKQLAYYKSRSVTDILR